MTFSQMFKSAHHAQDVLGVRPARTMAINTAARFASASSWPNVYIFLLHDDTREASVIGWAPMEGHRNAINEERAEFVDGLVKHGDADRVVARIKIFSFNGAPVREYAVTA